MRSGLQPKLLAIAAVVLYELLRQYSYHEIAADIARIKGRAFFFSIVLCALNYVVLTLYDTLAFRYIGRSLAYRRIALTAFLSYTFSQNIGLAFLSGGAVRYRFYSHWRIPAGDIARIILFTGTHFWFGLFLLGGVAGLAAPHDLALALRVSRPLAVGISAALLVPIILYLGAALFRSKPINLRGWEFTFPAVRLALAALAVASMDWLLAASTLYCLLPGLHGVTFPHAIVSFLVAQIAGVLSHLPGGVGVFETMMVLTLSPRHQASAIVGALIVFRIVYYLVPFMAGLLALLLYELSTRAGMALRVRQILRPVRRLASNLVPPALALGVFISGVVLLFSGATPAVGDRLGLLQRFLPLTLLETSHFINSIVGALLLVLAESIRRRLDNGYRFTCVLLGLGVAASLLKGLDYEEAAVLAVTLAAALLSSPYFHRKAAAVFPISGRHMLWVLGIMGASIWLGLFSYKHVQYAHELWWQFELQSDAPRFLRAEVAAAVLVLILGLRSVFLRPKPFMVSLPSAPELAQLRPLIEASPSTESNLALLGDKFLFVHPKGSAFIMYRVAGRSWVVLGDPIGNRNDGEELAWSFRELCDQYGAYAVFYEVSPQWIPLYLELGLSLLKLGEEAILSLESFSLEGGTGKAFRNTINKFQKNGYEFTIESVSEIPKLLPRLSEISQEWLASKNTREKGFSLGYFDAAYLSYFPAALVMKEGQILAFANLWPSSSKIELSADLMRHVSSAPNGLMDYLFLNIMLWGKAEGYKSFNLGMAPFSGFEKRTLAPLWHKLGTYLYRHGSHFYNFDGLRQYKEKFNPEWRPRYLAAPSGVALPIVLTNVAALISRGLKGVVAK